MKNPWSLLAALATTAIALGCAHSTALPRVDGSFKYQPTDTEKLARMPSCKVSVPLTQAEASQVAKLVDGVDNLEQRPDWIQMIASKQGSDQIRYVWCIPQGRGGVVFFALFRDGIAIEKMYTVMLD